MAKKAKSAAKAKANRTVSTGSAWLKKLTEKKQQNLNELRPIFEAKDACERFSVAQTAGGWHITITNEKIAKKPSAN